MQPLNDNLSTESIIPNITLKYRPIELKYYFVCHMYIEHYEEISFVIVSNFLGMHLS